MYISSADFMTRNTERRVEVAAPLLDRRLADRAVEIFNTCLRDNVKAREQDSDGNYQRVTPREGEARLNSQIYFYEQAYKAAEQAANNAPVQSAADSAAEVTAAQPSESAPVGSQTAPEVHRVKIRRVKRIQ